MFAKFYDIYEIYKFWAPYFEVPLVQPFAVETGHWPMHKKLLDAKYNSLTVASKRAKHNKHKQIHSQMHKNLLDAKYKALIKIGKSIKLTRYGYKLREGLQ